MSTRHCARNRARSRTVLSFFLFRGSCLFFWSHTILPVRSFSLGYLYRRGLPVPAQHPNVPHHEKDHTMPTGTRLHSHQEDNGDGNDSERLVPLVGSSPIVVCQYQQLTIPSSQALLGARPRQAISVEDLTPLLVTLLKDSGLQQGVLTVLSRHTTTALTINESESRLANDIASSLLEVIPPDERSEASTSSTTTTTSAASFGRRYQHNDIDLRPEGDDEADRCRANGWDIDDPTILQEWRDQEPINAHSHLLSMLLGSSESIPVVDGQMMIGQWQSVLLVDLDGPRDRTVGVQLMGYR